MSNSVDDLRDAQLIAFGEAIDDCLMLYRSSADQWNRSLPPGTSAEVLAATQGLMEDLARGLMIKIFLAIMQADRRFSSEERQLAQLLLAKLWGRKFAADEVGVVLQGLLPMADKFDWYRLLRPFEVPALRERVGEVETIVMRFGNLVAKADGTLSPEEGIQLKGLLETIHRHLLPVPIDQDGPLPRSEKQVRREVLAPLEPLPGAPPIQRDAIPRAEQPKTVQVAAPSTEERLRAALAALDELVGLDSIKTEVRELTRFLQVQQHRQQAGLPKTQISIHTVFAGNPGTGKTSVARILGEVFGALGIVSRGHLVEADRASLVAGYMGQTAERTNKVIDQALDGVLFVDEAYSLISDKGDDSYGQEAVQILLKRMEDDRTRLIVILAGYPHEMQRLLETNPGLASRFQRTLTFLDYTVIELCRIFQMLCDKNHYDLPAETRARLILGFNYLLGERDEHFGNGRLVRNIFEQAIRRLANRVADVVPLTKELLTRLEPGDVAFAEVPEAVVDPAAIQGLKLIIQCPGCQHASKVKSALLGRRVKCNKCGQHFTSDWGTPSVA